MKNRVKISLFGCFLLVAQVTVPSDRIIPVMHKGVAYNIRPADQLQFATLLSRSECNLLSAEQEKELKNILGSPTSFSPISPSMQIAQQSKEENADDRRFDDLFADLEKLQQQYDVVYLNEALGYDQHASASIEEQSRNSESQLQIQIGNAQKGVSGIESFLDAQLKDLKARLTDEERAQQIEQEVEEIMRQAGWPSCCPKADDNVLPSNRPEPESKSAHLDRVRKLQERERRLQRLSLMYASMREYEADLAAAFQNAFRVYGIKEAFPITHEEEELLEAALLQNLTVLKAEDFFRQCVSENAVK